MVDVCFHVSLLRQDFDIRAGEAGKINVLSANDFRRRPQEQRQNTLMRPVTAYRQIDSLDNDRYKYQEYDCHTGRHNVGQEGNQNTLILRMVMIKRVIAGREIGV
jgi:hypothetical protein